jgi:hypothetical protein
MAWTPRGRGLPSIRQESGSAGLLGAPMGSDRRRLSHNWKRFEGVLGMRRLRGKLTYSNVVATLALFIALGGGALAATQLKKNSVGTKQLKRNSVTGEK